jgi:phage terminase large subunit-like protein
VGESLLALKVREAGGEEQLIDELGAARVYELTKRWEAIARTEQLEPAGDWLTWLVSAGRGFGKTRIGAETVTGWAKSGQCGRMALIAPTAADARDVMVEGESGIVVCSDRADFRASYEPSKRRITWPNGALATVYSAQEADRLRGPQHDGAWCDEIAAWERPQDVWDQMQFGLRLGRRPRTIVTTTPRPIALVKALIKSPSVIVTRGSTYDNAVNLAPSFLAAIRKAYEGTRLGRQEINAEILDDNPGALWRMALIDAARCQIAPADFRRVVGGIDPAVSSNENSAETGIIFGATAMCRCKGDPELHGFVLEDVSDTYTPDQWARAAASGYHRHKCDRIVAEINNGGDLVESNLRTLGDPLISYLSVHASRGKAIRAEPIAALYEQGKVHHVGTFPKLEDQMTQWNPLADEKSPDRLDALVWLMTELMLGAMPATYTARRHHSPRRI